MTRNRSKQNFAVQKIHRHILDMKRPHKRVLLITADFLICIFSVWYSYYLRVGAIPPQYYTDIWKVALIVSFSAILIFWALGFYKILMRSAAIVMIVIGVVGSALSGLLLAVLNIVDDELWIPRSIPLIFPLVAFILISGLRVAGRAYYRYANRRLNYHEPIVIYGAGALGTQLAAAIEETLEYKIIGFIDDDVQHQGNRILGKRVRAIDELSVLTNQYPNLRVILAIQNISPEQRRNIVQKLNAYPINLGVMPAMSEIVTGEHYRKTFKKVEIGDLLGRKQVAPIPEFFENAIVDKSVLVTGAGGSIGSEICRQVVVNGPARLIMFDQSEIALYLLEQEFRELLKATNKKCEIHFVLGDCSNAITINNLFKKYKPNIVYHAAAYKHVPLIEDNIAEGIQNNIFSTMVMSQHALKHKAHRFVLVSTDKAVRPANVMGASKRVAEQVIQNIASGSKSTRFSIVRFGNVLDSSGSVIPLFRKQINSGGPVTVTDENVARYFMTIPEAAQLVVQAGFISKGGEVFVLDMGEPVKILQLAKLMIQLSDLTQKTESNPDGDIAIEIIGLRPGEKLYEELLIDGKIEKTKHPKIMNAVEVSYDPEHLAANLEKLKRAIELSDLDKCRKILRALVEGFTG